MKETLEFPTYTALFPNSIYAAPLLGTLNGLDGKPMYDPSHGDENLRKLLIVNRFNYPSGVEEVVTRLHAFALDVKEGREIKTAYSEIESTLEFLVPYGALASLASGEGKHMDLVRRKFLEQWVGEGTSKKKPKLGRTLVNIAWGVMPTELIEQVKTQQGNCQKNYADALGHMDLIDRGLGTYYFFSVVVNRNGSLPAKGPILEKIDQLWCHREPRIERENFFFESVGNIFHRSRALEAVNDLYGGVQQPSDIELLTDTSQEMLDSITLKMIKYVQISCQPSLGRFGLFN